jgi:hypothetical protein
MGPTARFNDKLAPQGRVEIFVTKDKPIIHKFGRIYSRPGYPDVYSDHRIEFPSEPIDYIDQKNIVVNVGKDAVITSLTTGYILSLARLAVGDRGTIPSDSTVPKVPVATTTELYNEVYRADAEAVVLNVGTPSVHEVKLVKTFTASDLPITSFSNQAKPVLNEVGIIMINPALPPPLPRPPVASPDDPPADEVMFAIRTYKSVPFEVSNDISVTFRYTIFIE